MKKPPPSLLSSFHLSPLSIPAEALLCFLRPGLSLLTLRCSLD